jgi:hypothetical protein
VEQAFMPAVLVIKHPALATAVTLAGPSHANKGAPRKIGAPGEPGFGLAGWNFAALQTVILNERQSRE